MRPRNGVKPAAFAILPEIKENVERSLFNVVERLTKTEAGARVPWWHPTNLSQAWGDTLG